MKKETNAVVQSKDEQWERLLKLFPDFKDKKDWRWLNAKNWVEVLVEHPEFVDKCDWRKLDGFCNGAKEMVWVCDEKTP